jgi:hypothetical protein
MLDLDRHLWIEVAEYLAAALGAIAIAWFLADSLGTPLWGELTSVRLR